MGIVLVQERGTIVRRQIIEGGKSPFFVLSLREVILFVLSTDLSEKFCLFMPSVGWRYKNMVGGNQKLRVHPRGTRMNRGQDTLIFLIFLEELVS